ncbi:MAG: biotin/lipoyl-binding protein [Proteobacteria bacterium]|nr:biotin/lipoyl-binding protein [Pseudomonadota bacterium]
MKMFRVVVNGNEYEVGIEELQGGNPARPTEDRTAPAPKPEKPKTTQKPDPPKPAASDGTGDTVVAPMPGTILRVAVSTGDTVVKGDTLLILEAMKMENEILAPKDGVVKQLNVSQGASVNPGDILVVLGS